jgi:peroxiredoxin
MHIAPIDTNLIASTQTSDGATLADLSSRSPVLLVMLRHEGCSFCRNAMSDIARLRSRIESRGTRIVLGHMNTSEEFALFAERYGLASVSSVADPERLLYTALGLPRARFLQLIGPKVAWAFGKSVLSGFLPGKIQGDALQLPGAFLIHHGKVIKAHAYRDASDRPDYVALATVETD